MKIYNKLVRDRIPEIIEKSDRKFSTRIAESDEYEKLLLKKLFEEAGEFSSSRDIMELADILEVIEAIAIQKNTDLAEILKLKQEKQLERGGFLKRIVLIDAEEI